MAKGAVMQQSAVVKWFGEQRFEVQDSLLEQLLSVFEKGKASRIRDLEGELERLKGRGPSRVPATTATAPLSAGGKAGKSTRASALTGRKVPAKYRHPKDKTLTWAGRGVHPKWVTEYLKGGGKLANLLIKK